MAKEEMTQTLTYALFNFFKDDELSLFYLGKFSDKSLLALTDIIHYSDKKNNGFGRLKSKTIYLIIETFQNIIRYGLKKETTNFFMTRKINKNIYISTSNEIYEKSILTLKKKIDELNSLSQDELKQKYKETILNKEFSKKGGAGLGLIEISRKTKQKINYLFETNSNSDKLFHLLINNIMVSSETLQIDDIKSLYHFFVNNHIKILFKHEFAESINEALVRISELNFSENNKRQKKLAFHLSVEILQNLSLHAYEVKENKKEGIFYIIEKDGNYIVNAGNFVHNYDVKDFDFFLKTLKNSSKEKLNELYLKQLTSEEFNGDGGLGFIDIARESINFSYNFFEITENYSFFAFSFII